MVTDVKDKWNKECCDVCANFEKCIDPRGFGNGKGRCDRCDARHDAKSFNQYCDHNCRSCAGMPTPTPGFVRIDRATWLLKIM